MNPITAPALTWSYVPNPRGYSRPRWQRSAALAGDGTVFAPAVMTGDGETAAVLKAGWDGDVPLVIDDGHAYLPTWWIAREYPHVADICALIESRMRPGGRPCS